MYGKEVPVSTLLKGVDKRVEKLWYDTKCTLKYEPKSSYSGRTSFFPNVITLREADERVFRHELGHLLHAYGTWKGYKTELDAVYKEERGSFKYFNKLYVCSSKEEFVAEGYALYELDRANFKKKCPKLYAYIVKELNNIKILFVM